MKRETSTTRARLRRKPFAPKAQSPFRSTSNREPSTKRLQQPSSRRPGRNPPPYREGRAQRAHRPSEKPWPPYPRTPSLTPCCPGTTRPPASQPQSQRQLRQTSPNPSQSRGTDSSPRAFSPARPSFGVPCPTQGKDRSCTLAQTSAKQTWRAACPTESSPCLSRQRCRSTRPLSSKGTLCAPTASQPPRSRRPHARHANRISPPPR